MSGAAPRARRFAALAAALALSGAPGGAADDGAALPVSRGNDFLWSGDGSTLLAFERDPQRGLLAVRAFDGAGGAPRWELAGERLAAMAGAAAADARLAAIPTFDGTGLLLGAGGRWWLGREAGASLAAVAELDGAADPKFSPDGTQVAFVRDGDLWAYAIESGAPRRLTTDGGATRDGEAPPDVRRRAGRLPTAGFDWSFDGMRLAFYRSAAGGAARLAVMDVADGAIRELELADQGPGLAVGWTWRFDSRAVAVLWLPAGEASLDLRLCHPERSYCRPLASRGWAAGRELRDDFRFLEDGFLWGAGDGAGISLYDPLGRERRALAVGAPRRLGVVAVFDATREVAVAIEQPDEEGFVRLLLVDLRSGAAREIAAAPGGPPVALSAPLRAWVRPGKSARGTFAGHLLERLDGTALRRFE